MRIIIDGSWSNDRCLVIIDGHNVLLTPRAFKFLVKLAWELKHPRNGSTHGWLFKEEIEPGYNQAKYLYRLKSEIRQALQTDWKVYENNHLGYYRLVAEPDDIEINTDRMREFPDVDIAQLATR